MFCILSVLYSFTGRPYLVGSLVNNNWWDPCHGLPRKLLGWKELEWSFSLLSQPYLHGVPRSLPLCSISALTEIKHGYLALVSIPPTHLVEVVLQYAEWGRFHSIESRKVTVRSGWNFHQISLISSSIAQDVFVMRPGIFHGWQRPLTAIVANWKFCGPHKCLWRKYFVSLRGRKTSSATLRSTHKEYCQPQACKSCKRQNFPVSVI